MAVKSSKGWRVRDTQNTSNRHVEHHASTCPARCLICCCLCYLQVKDTQKLEGTSKLDQRLLCQTFTQLSDFICSTAMTQLKSMSTLHYLHVLVCGRVRQQQAHKQQPCRHGPWTALPG